MSIDEVFAIRYWRLSCSLIIRAFSHHEITDLELLIVLEKETLLQLLSFMAQLLHKHNQCCTRAMLGEKPPERYPSIVPTTTRRATV